jgi:hypothetical protein
MWKHNGDTVVITLRIVRVLPQRQCTSPGNIINVLQRARTFRVARGGAIQAYYGMLGLTTRASFDSVASRSPVSGSQVTKAKIH